MGGGEVYLMLNLSAIWGWVVSAKPRSFVYSNESRSRMNPVVHCVLVWRWCVSRELKLPLGAFAELRKASINFVMSVYPSVLVEQLGSHRTDFHEI